MERTLKWLDEVGATGHPNRFAVLLRRAAFLFLLLMFASMPHSIAATQISWIIGMLCWLASLAFAPRASFRPGPLSGALWAFFIWSAVTSFTSYAPDISIDKLRGAAVFLIFIFAAHNLRTGRAVRIAVFTLVISCMVNVAWTPAERFFGRGVEIHGLAADGPLAKALLWEGDTLLEVNGEKVRTPEDVLAAIETRETSRVKFYRPDFEFSVDVLRSDIRSGTSTLEKLGITSWKKSRNWRSSGFYGHYTTYAEVLQLIGSLVFGMFVGRFASRKYVGSEGALRFLSSPVFLGICFAGISFALLLTVTRAAQLAFLISCSAIVFAGLGRKWLLVAAVVALPIAVGGLLFLQNARQVGFFDANDDSIKWRQTVWQEGIRLWTASPRNAVLGVGMDSVKRFAGEWRMFDDGRLNPGHFHSTPLQLLVERGIPGLALWILVLAVYARTLWHGLRSAENGIERGILLGCLGGAAGFTASGIVHYNLGDQEVAMTFYALMAIAARTADPEISRNN